jgi:hypothetical protein
MPLDLRHFLAFHIAWILVDLYKALSGVHFR